MQLNLICNTGGTDTFLGDALSSVHQLINSTGRVTMGRVYVLTEPLSTGKPGYNQSNSTHHASAMHAHRGGLFIFIKPKCQQGMIFELHSMTGDQVDRVKYERVLKFPFVNEQKRMPTFTIFTQTNTKDSLQ